MIYLLGFIYLGFLGFIYYNFLLVPINNTYVIVFDRLDIILKNLITSLYLFYSI